MFVCVCVLVVGAAVYSKNRNSIHLLLCESRSLHAAGFAQIACSPLSVSVCVCICVCKRVDDCLCIYMDELP